MAYAVIADLTSYGIPASALATISDDIKTSALDAASERVDGYLRSRYRLPLVSWGNDIREATVVIALWIILNRRGFMPSAGSDITIRERYEDTLAWLKSCARQEIQPDVKPSDTDDLRTLAPRFILKQPRGW